LKADSAPLLYLEPKVLPIPRGQLLRVPSFEKNSSNSDHAFHDSKGAGDSDLKSIPNCGARRRKISRRAQPDSQHEQHNQTRSISLCGAEHERFYRLLNFFERARSVS